MAVAACLLLAQNAIADDCCAAQRAAPAEQVASAASYPVSPPPQTPLFRIVCAESSALVLCCIDADSCPLCSCRVLPLHAVVRAINPESQRHECAGSTAHLASLPALRACALCMSGNQVPALSRAHARLARLQL